eukprot:g7366.t1
MESLSVSCHPCPLGVRLLPYTPCLSRLSSRKSRLPYPRRPSQNSRGCHLRRIQSHEEGRELTIPDYIVPAVAESSTLADQTVLFPDALGATTLYVEKDSEVISDTTPGAGSVPAPAVELESLSLVSTKPRIENVNPNQKMFAEIVAIALPALGTVLADPLMSLVDTACVGQISATQLAALGPNTAIFNFIFMAFSFIGSAVANILASNSTKTEGLESEEINRRKEYCETILSHSLVLAVGIGVLMTVLLFLTGQGLLKMMGASTTVMPAALPYLLIRALATPAALFIAVSQGACLGQQDMWTPMKVVAAAGLLNLIGDVILIIVCKTGTFGAALATAGAQIAGALYFFQYLRKAKNTSGPTLELKWKGLPTRSTLKPILEMGRVMLFRNMVLMLSFTAMTATATTMGTLTLAAHQVTLQLFWFLSYIPEPLSLTGQSLIARDKHDAMKVSQLSRVLVKFGAYSGLVLAGIVGVVMAFLGRFFSSDLSVIMEFQGVISHSMLSIFLCSLTMMFDGICIASKQIEHLPKLISISTGATLGFLWIAQRRGMGLTGVWSSMIIFFSSRVVLHVFHLARNWNMTPFGAAPHSLVSTPAPLQTQFAA